MMAVNISIGKFSRPKILDRYIIKEVMSFVALAVAALTILDLYCQVISLSPSGIFGGNLPYVFISLQ
jgi:hypothetical protein